MYNVIDIEGEGRVINIYVMKKVVNKVSLILYNPIKKEVRYLQSNFDHFSTNF
jgi:hypothetical protein